MDSISNKKIVLIPAYEPTISMINLLKELKNYSFEIILVNDGSGEKYQKIFKESQKYATILNHETNMGKGKAIKTGLKYINEKFTNEYVIITMDCDGQHTVKDAQKLLDYAIKNTNTLVLGKRVRSKKTPLRSKLGNSITRFVYRLLTGLDIYDTQTGLRAFSKELVEFLLQVEGDRFEYEMNVLLKCYSSKITIKEIPIETIYIDNNSHSHFNTFKDSLLVYKEIFKFLISSLLSFVIDYLTYSLFIIFFNKVILANIFARVISSIINYNINKKIVFKSDKSGYKSAIKYFLLVFIILMLNTIILNFLVECIFINKFIAKLITEILLFILSWFVQKTFIFNKSKE